MPRWLKITSCTLALAVAALQAAVGRIAAAADDDEIISAAAASALKNANFDENTFDQWVFNGVNNATAGRQRIETQIKLQMGEIERVCQLSEAQKQRLQLAARGDVQRFWQEFETLRQKFNAVKHDEERANQMWEVIQPLQLKQARGLTGPGSLLMKLMKTTLTPRQFSQYEAIQLGRRRFRYQATIAVALNSLEGSVALKHEQREALAKLLFELPPPSAFGQYDNNLVMYRLANLPAAKIQPLFDKRQWDGLTQQFNQYRGMRDFLIQQGMLTPEDLGDAKNAAGPLAPLLELIP